MKNILMFVGGLAIGGMAGVFGTKKYFQSKYQKQYEDDYAALEEYYGKRDEYLRDETNDTNYEDDEINPMEGDSKPGGRMTSEEREEIRKRLDQNWKGTTNYAAMYRMRGGYTENKLAESQHPLDQGEEGEEDPNDVMNESTPEEEAFNEHQRNKNRPPKIISAEDYSDLPASVDQNVLYFYVYDEVVADENEEMIDNPEILIGDALNKYGFADSDERVIFVMNYDMDTCYEVQKVDASWTDSH